MKIIKAKVVADVPLTEALLDQAIQRGQSRGSKGLHAVAVGYQAPNLSIGFEDGSAVLLPLANYPEFAGCTADDLSELELGFAGTAVCHTRLDLQVSIAGLISASQPLMNMAAVLVAARNGRQSSEAKAQAARLNGKKGGRPRKVEGETS